MKSTLLSLLALLLLMGAMAQKPVKIRKKDRKRDVLIETSMGNITIRLSDSTPLHRDNFIRLVKQHYYDSILFHRVIASFMIQAGDPNSRQAAAGVALGNGGPGYTLPAEFRTSLFHRKGALAAARMGDNVNPEKASSGSQFYIVQGKIYSEAGLDSLEKYRLKKTIPAERRLVYSTVGGVPHLDEAYTVFGQTIAGLDVLDSIAATATSTGRDRDRPLQDVRILKIKLVKRLRRNVQM